MKNFFLGVAGLCVVWAAYKYAGELMVKKVVEVAQNGGDEYKLEFNELEFPETNFEWNGGNLSGGWNQGGWNSGE